MKAQTKLALRRFALRWIRKAFDALEDRLHSAEVRLRNELADRLPVHLPVESPRIARTQGATLPAADSISHDEFRGNRISGRVQSGGQPQRTSETWNEWEARRSGVAPVSKKAARARRQRMSARDFDLKFSVR